MQRNSGHSVITPARTSRADAPTRRPTARERRTMMMPNPGDLTLAKLSAFLAATKAHPRFDAKPDQSPANKARMEATLAVLLSLVPLKKPRAGSTAAKQARTSSKAVSHD